MDSLFVEFGKREFVADAAIRHHVDPVADTHQLGQFGRHDDDGRALRSQTMNEPIDFGLSADIDAARRFIEDENLVRPVRIDLPMTSFC